MIEIFLLDLKLKIESLDEKCYKVGMNIVNNNITSEFISQEGNIIALAKGMNINNKIIMEVDPENWAVLQAKRWYILYHERA